MDRRLLRAPGSTEAPVDLRSMRLARSRGQGAVGSLRAQAQRSCGRPDRPLRESSPTSPSVYRRGGRPTLLSGGSMARTIDGCPRLAGQILRAPDGGTFRKGYASTLQWTPLPLSARDTRLASRCLPMPAGLGCPSLDSDFEEDSAVRDWRPRPEGGRRDSTSFGLESNSAGRIDGLGM